MSMMDSRKPQENLHQDGQFVGCDLILGLPEFEAGV
jgi:hypothetical protein